MTKAKASTKCRTEDRGSDLPAESVFFVKFGSGIVDFISL